MRPRRHPLATSLLVVGAMGLAAIGVTQLRHEDEVLVVGDSMSALSTGPLREHGHNHHYDVKVEAQSGVPLAARTDVLQQAAASGVDRIVVELGTNDVLLGEPQAIIDALIDQTTTVMQDVPCVVFVNVGILRPDDPAGALNAHLAADVALHPNEHVHDWASLLLAHPEWSA